MSRYRVAFLDLMAPNVQEEINRCAGNDFEVIFPKSYDRDEHAELARHCDFVIAGGGPCDAGILRGMKGVRLVQKWGIGVDKIDIKVARELGIPVAIAAGCNAAPVAELAITLMLGVYRQVAWADSSLRAGQWVRAQMRERCYQLGGKTVGLLGFGAIGRTVAHRLRGFDNEILYYDIRRAEAAIERALRATYVGFEELLARADVLSIHAPLTEITNKMINASVFERMKPGAILVNTARGEIVDEAALEQALRSGRLRGAGLDVFDHEPPRKDHPLYGFEQVVLTPHVGGGVFDNVANVAHHAFDNMRKVLRGEPLSPADVIVPVQAG